MSVASLPTVISTPPKTRTKLPIYLVSAIVVALVVIVVVINIVHRLPDDPKDSDDLKTTISSGLTGSVTSKPHPNSTPEPTLITSTADSTSTSESDSSSSNSDEDHKDSENSTLIHVTVTTTAIPTSTVEETTFETTAESTTENLNTTPSPSTESQNGSTDSFTTSSSESSTASPSSTVLPDPTLIPPSGVECGKTCSVSVVESIPRGVRFTDRVFTKNAYESWAELLGSARSEIDIFAFKMNLRGKELRYDVDNSTFEGRQIYGILEEQAKSGVLIKLIDCQPPIMPETDYDADELERLGLIQRQGLDMNDMNGGGGGVHHSKTFIVDDRHLFVGSLNFEWKSFSQKLEIGLEFHDCPCIAKDASSLFDQMFNSLSGGRDKLETVDFQPHRIGNSTFQFLASPSFFLTSSHSWDLEALLNLIYEADESVDISVMQYFPSWIYFKNREFYSQIDNAIRMSVSRGIKFRILVSGDQKEEQKLMFSYLHSLSVLHSPHENRFVQIKFILIPQTAQESYKDRKMHAKFMLSEKRVLIGSSNYGPEYFYKSTGTAVVVDEEPFHGDINRQMRAVFDRYWHSSFTQPLRKFGESKGFLPKPPKPSNPFAGWFGLDRIGVNHEQYSASIYEKNSGENQILDPIIFI